MSPVLALLLLATPIEAELERALSRTIVLQGLDWELGSSACNDCIRLTVSDTGSTSSLIEMRVTLERPGEPRPLTAEVRLEPETTVDSIARALVIRARGLLVEAEPRPLIPELRADETDESGAEPGMAGGLLVGSQAFINPRRSDDNPAGLLIRGELFPDSGLGIALEAAYMTSNRRSGVGDVTSRAVPLSVLLQLGWRAGAPYRYGVGGGVAVIPVRLRYEVDNPADLSETVRESSATLLSTRLEVYGGFELGAGFSFDVRLGALFHDNRARVRVSTDEEVTAWRSPLLQLGASLEWVF